MKRDLKRALIIFFLAIASGSYAKGDHAFTELSREEQKEFQSKCRKLEDVIQNRNFSVAKSIVEELFPLIKKDIKSEKKLLAKAKKNDFAPEMVMKLTENVSKKGHLFDSMKSLINSSSAALRARSDQFISMIHQYDDLMLGK